MKLNFIPFFPLHALTLKMQLIQIIDYAFSMTDMFSKCPIKMLKFLKGIVWNIKINNIFKIYFF